MPERCPKEIPVVLLGLRQSITLGFAFQTFYSESDAAAFGFGVAQFDLCLRTDVAESPGNCRHTMCLLTMKQFVPRLLLLLVAAVAATLSAAVVKPQTTNGEGSNPSPFAKPNLHVWAFEEYDAIDRTPSQRAQLLKEIGIGRAGYICRNKARTAEFESYLRAYRENGIDLVSVWTPVHTARPLEEPQIRGFLEVVDRHELRLQWWLTLEENFDRLPSARRVEHAASQLLPLIAEANRRGCRLVIYGHGRDKWFTQCENQLAILKQILDEQPNAHVGIVYNFHQSHAQMDRLKTVLPQLKPYLVAVNLNGMRSDGPQIVPLGAGDREQTMINLIRESGWYGPVGVIGHNRREDSKLTLQRNLKGLHALLDSIGDDAGSATY